MNKKLFFASLAVNILCLSWILHINIKEKSELVLREHSPREEYYDELCPTVIYNKDESVDLSFSDTGVAKRGKKKFDNCINPETTNLKLRVLYLKKCLPLFKEYIPKVKKVNKRLLKSCPNYVPSFQESSSVVDYPYNKIKWKKLYRNPIKKENILNNLHFYTRNKGKIFNFKSNHQCIMMTQMRKLTLRLVIWAFIISMIIAMCMIFSCNMTLSCL
jgi:hypothetical protein